MTFKKSFIEIIGKIWMPNITAATILNLDRFDISNIIENDSITREDIDQWLTSHSGDFSRVIDFYADIELPNGKNIVISWEKEESEYIFNDCMYAEEY
jgi:hypothetical protein